MSAATGRCTPSPTPRPRGCPQVSGTPGSGPSRSWRWSWCRPPSRPASGSGRWWPTAPTATTPASPMPWGPPGSRSCWPSSPARAPGRRRRRPTPRSRRPASSAGAAPAEPGRWRRITRRFRDGHTETWWAADAQLGGWGPDRRLRLVVATTDPASLPGHSSWYLLTNLPRPASRRAQQAEPGRGGAAVRAAQLGRAGLQAGQRRARLGRLPGPHQTGPSAGTGRWCAVRSRSAGRPSSPNQPASAPVPGRRSGGRAGGDGDRASAPNRPSGASWPVALRAVRAWLAPWSVLQRCWRAWSPAPPPRQLQRLLDGLAAGQPLHLYLPP